MFGEGNGNPLQCSCLENPMDEGAWWAAVHGVAKSRARLIDFTFTFHFNALEKEMATHSSVLAWRTPGMVEPGGLPSMGLHRVGLNWFSSLAAAGGHNFPSKEQPSRLISWLQSPSAVILEPPKNKSDTVSTVSPSISHEVIGPDAMKWLSYGFVFIMIKKRPIQERTSDL